jgi:DNA mismatch endonuclease (patch repair protein)
MTDRVDEQTRHRIMRANRSRDTSPEVEVRRALFGRGLRYRLDVAALPGRPDLTFPKYRAAVFVNGCYWHGHECHRSPRSRSNPGFWKAKIARNRLRDWESRVALLAMGWRVLVIWECAIRRRTPPFAQSEDLDRVQAWLLGESRLGILSENGFEECV